MRTAKNEIKDILDAISSDRSYQYSYREQTRSQLADLEKYLTRVIGNGLTDVLAQNKELVLLRLQTDKRGSTTLTVTVVGEHRLTFRVAPSGRFSLTRKRRRYDPEADTMIWDEVPWDHDGAEAVGLKVVSSQSGKTVDVRMIGNQDPPETTLLDAAKLVKDFLQIVQAEVERERLVAQVAAGQPKGE